MHTPYSWILKPCKQFQYLLSLPVKALSKKKKITNINNIFYTNSRSVTTWYKTLKKKNVSGNKYLKNENILHFVYWFIIYKELTHISCPFSNSKIMKELRIYHPEICYFSVLFWTEGFLKTANSKRVSQTSLEFHRNSNAIICSWRVSWAGKTEDRLITGRGLQVKNHTQMDFVTFTVLSDFVFPKIYLLSPKWSTSSFPISY